MHDNNDFDIDDFEDEEDLSKARPLGIDDDWSEHDRWFIDLLKEVSDEAGIMCDRFVNLGPGPLDGVYQPLRLAFADYLVAAYVNRPAEMDQVRRVFWKAMNDLPLGAAIALCDVARIHAFEWPVASEKWRQLLRLWSMELTIAFNRRTTESEMKDFEADLGQEP
ncbi:hypothetical protein GCM10025782_23100 [Pedococcus ginsenosidimutans]|uniref:Tail assembly chaperone n=1 Tax=Pedococcus ginsenosidimutans TaxID=490570 RepID=A0ABP8Y931_9MICO